MRVWGVFEGMESHVGVLKVCRVQYLFVFPTPLNVLLDTYGNR